METRCSVPSESAMITVADRHVGSTEWTKGGDEVVDAMPAMPVVTKPTLASPPRSTGGLGLLRPARHVQGVQGCVSNGSAIAKQLLKAVKRPMERAVGSLIQHPK